MPDYPTIDNFDPGGDDAEMTRNVEQSLHHKINGEGTNGIRDRDDDYRPGDPV